MFVESRASGLWTEHAHNVHMSRWRGQKTCVRVCEDTSGRIGVEVSGEPWGPCGCDLSVAEVWAPRPSCRGLQVSMGGNRRGPFTGGLGIAGVQHPFPCRRRKSCLAILSITSTPS